MRAHAGSSISRVLARRRATHDATPDSHRLQTVKVVGEAAVGRSRRGGADPHPSTSKRSGPKLTRDVFRRRIVKIVRLFLSQNQRAQDKRTRHRQGFLAAISARSGPHRPHDDICRSDARSLDMKRSKALTNWQRSSAFDSGNGFDFARPSLQRLRRAQAVNNLA